MSTLIRTVLDNRNRSARAIALLVAMVITFSVPRRRWNRSVDSPNSLF
jgi:hypothetical protein